MSGLFLQSWRSVKRLLLGCLFAAGLACGLVYLHVGAAAAGAVFSVEAVPVCDALLVLGARIHADGTPYDLLRDRLDTALLLWQRGAARRVLLSGRGTGGLGENEVAAMRRYLEAAGVPEKVLVDDPLGLRTLDSIDRAAVIFSVRTAIVVTNDFHLPRALYLSRNRGLPAIGVVANERVHYTWATRCRNALREPLARLVAWFDIEVLHRRGQGCE